AIPPLDGALPDVGVDSGVVTNPDVTLVRELTFEQVPGTNGWSSPEDVFFKWTDFLSGTGRDRVPDPMVRAAGGINIPDISDVAYRGSRSAMFTMKPWSGRSASRTDLEMVGNVTGDPAVSRFFPQGETHLVGFAMRIEHATWPGGGFQLMHQYHNTAAPKAGYGITNNPALSLLRRNNDDLMVIARDNRPGGERLNTTHEIPGGVRAGQWVRWVFKTRFNNFDSGENGLIEVWSAVGDEPLELHFRVDDRPLGYTYADPANNYETIVFDCYGEPRQEEARVYFDEIRIAKGDLDPSVVDPLSWRSYQHPLNQPFNDDLR
ncbi:MAG: heparin lyase I family protein, partial [Myxococcota bacterium]